MLWWFLGPLTLLSFLQGVPIDWSYIHGANLFGSLIGHIVYGILVGLVYAVLDRLWVGFFIESDPLHRAPASAGAQTLRSLGWGLIASLIGGLAFSRVGVSKVGEEKTRIGGEARRIWPEIQTKEERP